MIDRKPKRLWRLGFLGVLLVLPMMLGNDCKKNEAQIGDFTVRSARTREPLQTVQIGEEVSIEAEVSTSPKDLPVTYRWKVKGEEGEEIKIPSEREPIAVYKAPSRPETRFVTLLVLAGDQVLDEKSIPIKVEAVTSTLSRGGEEVVLPPRQGGVPAPGEVQITRPQNGATGLGSRVLVTGTANIPENLSLWLVVYPHQVGLYFPQSFKGGNPVGKGIKGVWSETAALGEDNLGKGEQFDIIAVVADERATQSLSTTWKDWTQARTWPGLSELPRGASEKARITVTRAP